jgi:uncharacterized protein YjbJ (UPF0337 family)
VRDLERNLDGVVAINTVDKDRIKGSAEQAKGAVKETAGKVFGDKKLETEGRPTRLPAKCKTRSVD